jgi:exonuclease SbcC
MRLERVGIGGLFTFRDLTLDLRGLPPGLIAIVGPNGSGKTALLEACPAALYRVLPSRGGQLPEYVTGREGALEIEFSLTGRGTYRARLVLDATRRATQAVLEQIGPDGRRRVLNDGKVTTYDAALAALVPPLPVFLASAFAAQNRAGSFATLGRADRKALFVRLLGLDQVEQMAQTARTASSLVSTARATVVARITVLREAAGPAVAEELDRLANALQAEGGQAELRRRDLQTRLQALRAERETVDHALAAGEAARARHEVLTQTLAGLVSERRDLESTVDTLPRRRQDALQVLRARRDAEIADLDRRLANNRAVLADADAIRAAVAAVRDLDAQIAARRAQIVGLMERLDELAAQERALVAQRHEAELARQELARADRDAAILDQVPFGARCAEAGCGFLRHALAAREVRPTLAARAERAPVLDAEIAAVEADRRALLEALDQAKQAMAADEAARAAHQRRAALADALAAAEARVAELEARRHRVLDEADRAQAETEARFAREEADLRARLASLTSEIDRLRTEAAMAEAEAAQASEALTTRARLDAALAQVQQAWDEVTATLARVEAGRVELARRREELRQRRAGLQALEADLAWCDRELAEWDLLARALGRDGLPVLEIDAAGPAVSAYANEILEACFGPRFSVELITQEAKVSGPGLKESFTLRIVDNQHGGERDLTDLSGGEQVIVDEALKNAIAIYANRRGAALETCWRDETTGALDADNAERYITMLRRVREIGGFHQILFVTHNPESAALADAQIRVAHGRVAIVWPPYPQEDAHA